MISKPEIVAERHLEGVDEAGEKEKEAENNLFITTFLVPFLYFTVKNIVILAIKNN